MLSRLWLVFLLVALAVLAGLQYQWIGQVSVAERQRLEAGLRDSSTRFAQDLSEEILRPVVRTFDMRDGAPQDAGPILSRYEQWTLSAPYAHLLRTLYFVRPDSDDGVELLRVDPQKQEFEPVQWPQELAELKDALTRELQPPERPRQDGPPSRGRPYGGGEDPPRGGRGGPGSRRARVEGMLAVLIPIDRPRGRGPGPGPDFGGRPREGWLLAELDEGAITKEILPELAARRFPVVGDQDYRVAVVAMSGEPHTIFTTGGAWTDADLETPDHAVDLDRAFLEYQGRFGFRGFGARGGPPAADAAAAPRRGGPPGGPRFTFFGQNWRLMVKHQAGSLESAVQQLRRRDLAISFGILVVLGISAGTAVVSGQRARTLGKLQMEFAAGVSHELRTPLTVIQSAAHNLRAGVVHDKEGIAEYATIVQSEARRLSDMVEHVMTYAETQSGRKRYDIAPIDAVDVVERAVRHTELILRDSNVTLNRSFDPELPPVMADASALTQCLQNLLSNAVKYGQQNGVVEVDVDVQFDRNARKVRIAVTDRGDGVPEADIPHLFEAFHRGSNATTHTPGNGLGLHLVRKIMEAQHGTVTYARANEGGACFTLTIPAADSFFL